MEASWWERLTVGETGSCSDGGAMLSESLIQFFVDGQGCVPSLLFEQQQLINWLICSIIWWESIFFKHVFTEPGLVSFQEK